MGLFTSVVGIIEPWGEVEVQIKTGNDGFTDWEYRVGDTVKWSVDETRVGSAHLVDGIYQGYADRPISDAYVAIKDHKIVAVGKMPDYEYPDDSPEDYNPSEARINSLVEKYGITVPTKAELYTFDAIVRDNEYWAEIRAKNEAEFQEYMKAHPDMDEFVARLVMPLSVSLNYQAIGRSLLMEK